VTFAVADVCFSALFPLAYYFYGLLINTLRVWNRN